MYKKIVLGILTNTKGEVLITQRSEKQHFAGYWEFTGGKVEQNETFETALVRELKEEIGIVLNESSLSPLTFSTAVYDNEPFLFLVYETSIVERNITLKEGQKDYKWVSLKSLKNFQMPPINKNIIKNISK